MNAPVAIDLFAGLGGWTEGLLAEGWECIGFDIERHVYGEHRYPAQLVLQDVRTLHGSQFKDAHLIVASSPCQEFSYRAMPWKRAKALGPPLLGMELFAQAARIQREACEAAGRYIPMVQENVRGAQKYVGRARWHYGSYYLWGDVPALMPVALSVIKCGKHFLHGTAAERRAAGSPSGWWTSDSTKNSGGSWFAVGSPGQKVVAQNPDGRKVPGLAHGRFPAGGLAQGELDGRKNGGDWFGSGENCSLQRRASSKSSARKAASARIAKIPLALASFIAYAYHPRNGVADESENGNDGRAVRTLDGVA